MSMGLIVVEVCDANAACTEDLFQLEAELEGVSVLETECMSFCDLCATRPYVFVNGDILDSTDVPSLIDLIRTGVEQWTDFYSTDI